jgi:hypothetical protein
LKENGDLDSVAKIHELLIPFEYTKLDKIIEITFTVAKDTTAVLNEEQADGTDSLPVGQEAGAKQQHTPPQMISGLRNSILESLTHAYAPLVKKSRALYWSADKSLRVVVTVSKEYLTGDGGYWYAYHSDWHTFLSEAAQGFYVLGCIGRKEAYALPYKWIHSRLKNLNITEREGKSHWHIILNPDEAGTLTLRLKSGQNELLEDFKIVLAK